MSFRLKILCIVTFGCLFSTGGAVFIASLISTDAGKQALVEKSQAILTRLEAARNYVANQGLLNDIIQSAKEKYPDGNLPKEEKQKVLKVVPIYASILVGAENAKNDNYKFRVPAREPRREENRATPEETEILEEFEANLDLKELVRFDEDKQVVHVMRPIRISKEQGCLNCHGHPSTSPWGNGLDIIGKQMEDWSDGQLHGMFKITSDLKPVYAEAQSNSISMLKASGLIMLVVLGLVFLLMLKPINLLNYISQQLALAAKSNDRSSGRLKNSSHSVSEASAEQSAAIQETVASMTEMNSMVTKTSSLVEETEGTSKKLSSLAQQGSHIMEGMSESMSSIRTANEQLQSMIEIIKDISKKTNVINEIVFKTQLLSVNASIEAARAGQHGKGFAVVAEEVGNLAQVSGRAAEDIRAMLENSQKQVEEIVNDTTKKVGEGEKVTQSAIENFSEISSGISVIQKITTQVTEATEQQLTGIQQISEAMSQMDTASQRNDSMAMEVSELGQELFVQSQSLAELNISMQTLVKGFADEKSNKKEIAKVALNKVKDPVTETEGAFSSDLSDDDDFSSAA